MDIGEVIERGEIKPKELPILDPKEDEGAGKSDESPIRIEPDRAPAREKEYA